MSVYFSAKNFLKHLQVLQRVHGIFLVLKRRLKSLISFVDEQNLFSQSCPSQMNRLVLHFARKMHLQCTADKPHLLFIHFYLSMPFLVIVFFSECFLLFRFFDIAFPFFCCDNFRIETCLLLKASKSVLISIRC